ncbi:MAG: hypothetical protein KDC67_08445, partial [Ignavibacteriae bacterium]|nr:hypothetical protein [Ignavibacteriota bacterium]
MKNILLHIVILLLFSTFTNFAQLTIKDQESTPNTLLQVNDEGTAGSITLASLSSISVPTSKLYNLGGNLFWNGIALGASGASCINDLSDAISDESNVFLGQGAGTNDDGNNNNTAVGKNALNSNTYGYGNTAYGCEALFIMAAGNNNTAIGSWALLENSGNSNTAIGTDALSSNQQGNYNTAIGASSLMQNGTGSNNTSIGYNAGPLFIDGDNTTALGSGAVPTEINSVAIGNTSVTSIGGYVNWSVISDGRFKNNVSEDVAGLNFIMGLRPIIYNLN